ncbi:MAG: DUF4111 domain-containing protein [Anaerolineales bacterium]|nr:DUF4111 domain-containing protein [Anaerolineales bacterium]
MTIPPAPFAPYPEVDAVLFDLLDGIGSILGSRLVGLYLDGSLAGGDFDPASDIDFLAVTEEEIDTFKFAALQAMHERLAAKHPRWGVELEGSYISRGAVRRYDPALSTHPNLERGKPVRLKMARHDEDWLIHYYVVRERGIPLLGPDPKTLIDPVPPEALQSAMRATLEKWWASFLVDPSPLMRRGYQSYAVLTMCRIGFTLATGSVASKSDAAGWAKAKLDARWGRLVDRALAGRFDPNPETEADEIRETQEFIRYTLDRSRIASAAGKSIG